MYFKHNFKIIIFDFLDIFSAIFTLVNAHSPNAFSFTLFRASWILRLPNNFRAEENRRWGGRNKDFDAIK